MKVFTLAPQENWIVDRFASEWNADNADIATSDPREADVIWLFADWAWSHLSFDLLRSRKVLTTIHHIVPDKFHGPQRYEFQARDELTNVYHVPNERTRDFVSTLTSKPIHVIPYWANQKIWRQTSNRDSLRMKHGIPLKGYVLGSFQRDTEGAGISHGQYLPKLEKGPDLLADYFEKVHHRVGNIMHVVLAGWRRQYLISRLKASNIPHSYFDLPSQETLNELYQTLDIYPVTARFEGGPQSLLECGLLGIPVVSTPVGMAEQVLPSEAINHDILKASPAVPNVRTMMLPQGYAPYRHLLETL